MTVRRGSPEITGKKRTLRGQAKDRGNEGLSDCQTTGQGAYERGRKPREGRFADRERRRTFLGARRDVTGRVTQGTFLRGDKT